MINGVSKGSKGFEFSMEEDDLLGNRKDILERWANYFEELFTSRFVESGKGKGNEVGEREEKLWKC